MTENPFAVLGATPADPRSALKALRKKASLQLGQDAAEAAYAALIKPESRLAAELRWGQAPEPLAWFNHLLDEKEKPLLSQVSERWGAMDAAQLLTALNTARTQGGWRCVQPEELRDGLKTYGDEIAAALDERFAPDAAAMTALVQRYAGGEPNYANNEMVERLVARYELRTRAEADRLREALLEQAAAYKAPHASSWKAWKVRKMCRRLRSWNACTRPVRGLRSARGLRCVESEALADEIRLFMASGFNRFRLMRETRRLIRCLRECFAEYEKLQRQLEEDEQVVLSAQKAQYKPNDDDAPAWMPPLGLIAVLLAALLVLFGSSRAETLPMQKAALETTLFHAVQPER